MPYYGRTGRRVHEQPEPAPARRAPDRIAGALPSSAPLTRGHVVLLSCARSHEPRARVRVPLAPASSRTRRAGDPYAFGVRRSAFWVPGSRGSGSGVLRFWSSRVLRFCVRGEPRTKNQHENPERRTQHQERRTPNAERACGAPRFTSIGVPGSTADAAKRGWRVRV